MAKSPETTIDHIYNMTISLTSSVYGINGNYDNGKNFIDCFLHFYKDDFDENTNPSLCVEMVENDDNFKVLESTKYTLSDLDTEQLKKKLIKLIAIL